MATTTLFDKVLLLEDDESHAFLIRRALKDLVNDVQHCFSFQDAIEQVRIAKYDLIVTDLQIPDVTGLQHVASLHQAGRGTPILVLTSSTNLRDAVEAMQKGAKDFIVKNFDQHFSEVLHLSLSRVFAQIQLEAEKKRYQRETELLKVSIENSNDVMAVIDHEASIIYHNKAFKTFASNTLRSNSHELPGIITSILSEEVALALKKTMETLLVGGAWHREFTLDGNSQSAFEMSLSRLDAGSDGDHTANNESFFVIWIRDISEQKRREKFQREILSTTTHDLKGPLGAILISCDLLSSLIKDNQRASEIVLRMDSSARGAVNLIDEFLSARRLQEGTFILKPNQYDIDQLCQEVLEDYRTIAASRKIELSFEPSSSEASAKVDRLALTRILGNLLSNALKFTPKGGQVWLRCQKAGAEIRLIVEDTGSGLEASEINRIFERFSRLDKHREISGSGIGLFVVKCLVAAHGGKIEVTSTAGKGTSFVITLPIEPPVNERGDLIALDFA